MSTLERIAEAIADDFVLYGNLYGKAIAVGDDVYREIARTALSAVTSTVLDFHEQDGDFCTHDGFIWPCQTVRALSPNAAKDAPDA